jgi:hypothetical protein
VSALIEYRKALITNKKPPNNEKERLRELMSHGDGEEGNAVYPRLQERNRYVEREKKKDNLEGLRKQMQEKAIR